jgi:uncharacterized protein with ParB-like and HNH nuclease domain
LPFSIKHEIQTKNHRVRSVIIDGQQRFTKVTLILAAIRNALAPNSSTTGESETWVRSIHEMLLLDPIGVEK